MPTSMDEEVVVAAILELAVGRVSRLCRELSMRLPSAIALSPTAQDTRYQLVSAADPESGRPLGEERFILKKEMHLIEIEKYLSRWIYLASIRTQAIEDMKRHQEEAE